MQTEEITHYSQCLDRVMHIMRYGHDGLPFLAFPTQDSMCHNYEDFGMIGVLQDFIDEGRIRLFVVDTVDRESWSGGGSLEERSARQELESRAQNAMEQLEMRMDGGLTACLGMRVVDAALHMLGDMKTFREAGVPVATDGPGARRQFR